MTNSVFICRAAEESSRATACEDRAGFFAKPANKDQVWHVERSETSSGVAACGRATGFFAKPQKDKRAGLFIFMKRPAGSPVGPRSQNDNAGDRVLARSVT